MNLENKKRAEKQLNKALEKVTLELKRNGEIIPYIPYDNNYTDVVDERGIDWWTNGFWSGVLWQLYDYSKDEMFADSAKKQEIRLDEALHLFNDIHHDVGFIWLHTAIAHYKLLGNQQSFRTGLHAANLLAGRFNIEGQYIVAWNDNPGWVIIDSMMNLPLLYWASNELKDPRFEKIARQHADTIAKYLVRDDGSVGHIASFNPETGEFIEQVRGQGFSSDSAWSRGNAWAIYGFALSYRYTNDPYYLSIAKQTAKYFIENISKTNYIPLVDFKAPQEPIIFDTSAGLCAACGFLEISKLVSDDEIIYYENIAVKIINSIESKYANWNLEEDGIIGGGTEAYHRPATHEVPLIYSDYFFIEGLLRILGKEQFIW